MNKAMSKNKTTMNEQKTFIINTTARVSFLEKQRLEVKADNYEEAVKRVDEMYKNKNVPSGIKVLSNSIDLSTRTAGEYVFYQREENGYTETEIR